MLGAFRSPHDDRWYRLALGALVLWAWLVMALWGASPSADLLHHREIGERTLFPVSRMAVFVVGWTIMTVAMMLPGSLPLVNAFARMTAAYADRHALLARLGAGYLSVWAAFGAAVLAGDLLLHAIVERGGVFQRIGAAVPPLVLLAGGAYQFTSLKDRCLSACRSPYAFLVAHWRGCRRTREAWLLGVRHGVFCVGCCWTLMVLMFAVGVAHLGWMLVLGAVMTAERATRWGRRMTKPAGAVLALWALLHLIGAVGLPAD